MANWDESKHPRDDDGKFGSGGGGSVGDTQPQAKEKLKSMIKSAAVSVAAGGMPTKDDVVFEYNHKMYYVGKDSEHMVDDFVKRGLVKRIRGYHNMGGGGPAKKPVNKENDIRDFRLQPEYRRATGSDPRVDEVWKDIASRGFWKNAALMPPMYVANSVQTIEGDAPLAVQLAPFGEFKGVLNKADGKKTPIVQHLDQAAFERILNAWNAAGSPELLVDADHLSCEGGSTKAFAWASNLRVEDGGLYADFRFTDAGRAAVNAREYRFVSPVFNCDENGEAVGLQSVALTNRPNLPVSCVLNRESSGVNNVEDNEGKPNMEKILSALGLGSDASEDDAVAAIDGMKKKIADNEAAALNAEAEKFADDNKDRIENRQAVVDLYVKNGKDVAEAFLAAFKAPEKAPEKPAQTVLNAKSGVTPGTVTPLREGLAKCKNAAEKCAYITAHAAEFAAEGK